MSERHDPEVSGDFLAVVSGGAAGGLLAGLAGFEVYGLMPVGVAAIPVYVGEAAWGNLLLGAGVMLLAFAVAFAATWLIGFDQPDAKTVDQLTGEEGG